LFQPLSAMNNLDRVDQVLQVIDQLGIGERTIGYKTALRRIVKTGDQCVALSQMCYWYGRGKDGQRRLRAHRNGKYWIAKTYLEFGEEIGLSERQARQAIGGLVDLGYVERRRYKYAGLTMCHLRIIGHKVQQALTAELERRLEQ
jgi:DNA-binding transcriptional regulator PaaX